MALAMSQPPEDAARMSSTRLGGAAGNSALLAALQEELGNNTFGGLLAKRLETCESELAVVKAQNVEMLTEMGDLRILMSQQNAGMVQLAEQSKVMQKDITQNASRQSLGEPGDVEPVVVAKRVSWNQMREADQLQTNQSVKVGETVVQESRDSDDITVDSWNFKMSCWDAAAFVGDTNLLLCGEALANLFLLLLNIGIQACFVIIVFLSLTSSSVDESARWGYHMWRTNTGHTVQFMDKNTEESLVSRVCRDDRSLYLSDTQTQQVAAINAYLYDSEPFNGPMMALLAIYVWTLTCSKEFHVLKDMCMALWRVPGGETLIIKAGIRLKLTNMSNIRFTWIMTLAVLRFAVAFTIMYAGVMFLAVTISLEDILLNAIALEFILNVDELLYNAMAPMKTRRLLLLLRPLALKKGRAFSGVDSNLYVWFTLSGGFTAFVLFYYLLPEMDNMKDAKHELCGGYLDFSYSPTVLGAVFWARQGNSVEEAEELFKTTQRYKILRALVDGDSMMGIDVDGIAQTPPVYWERDNCQTDDCAKTMNRTNFATYLEDHAMPFIQGPGWSALNLDSWNVQRFAEQMNSACIDIANEKEYFLKGPRDSAFVDALNLEEEKQQRVFRYHEQKQLKGNASMIHSLRNAAQMVTDGSITCAELKPHCNDFFPPGLNVRMFCPETCGCRDPGSDLALPFGPMGCPDPCRGHKAYTKILNEKNCSEEAPEVLAKLPAWIDLGTHWNQAAMGWGSNTTSSVALVGQGVNLMANLGCDSVELIKATFGVDICAPPDLKPLRFHCPIQCGCTQYLAEFCPTKCANYVAPPPAPPPPTGPTYHWTQSGIDFVAGAGYTSAMAQAGGGKEAVAGDQVTDAQVGLMAAVGGVGAAVDGGWVTKTDPPKKAVTYKWTKSGVDYITGLGFAAALGNPAAGDAVSKTQAALVTAVMTIADAFAAGYVEEA